MNEFVTSTLIVIAEFGVVVSVFFLVFILVVFLKRKKDSNTVTKFASQFKESIGTRRDSLAESVQNTFRVTGDESEGAINEIMNKERTICSNVLKIFSGRDKGLIMNLKDDLDGLSGAYHNLAALGHEQSTEETIIEAPTLDENDIESELHVLRVENKRLKEDLKKSLENIDYLQTQYTELFEKTKR